MDLSRWWQNKNRLLKVINRDFRFIYDLNLLEQIFNVIGLHNLEVDHKSHRHYYDADLFKAVLKRIIRPCRAYDDARSCENDGKDHGYHWDPRNREVSWILDYVPDCTDTLEIHM